MTATENSQEQQLPGKEEFFDAVRRHICQALGFDFVFVDIVREVEIVNLISFSAEDDDKEAREFVDTLSDENQQPLTVANSQVSQKVKQSQRPWIGKVFMVGGKVKADSEPDSEVDDDDLDDDDDASTDQEGYPYSIVPILQMPHGNAGTVRGLIRVLSFDPTREITQQDLATLKLMGEHLSTKMSQFAPASVTQTSQPNPVSFDTEHVLVVHTNRLVRRRYSRILTAAYQVLEADNAERAVETLKNNRVDLIVLDSEVKTQAGQAFCRTLKESPQYKHVPVILVTSDTNPNARVDGLNVGADDCLSESCFDSELMARVRSSMRHRKTERELAIQLQLLEDYAQRLEQATEHLSQDKQLQLKRNRELELLRWESDILRSQDTLLHRISNTIRQSFNITENLHKMLEAFSGWFNLDCCFVVLPSEDEPEDSIRSEYYNDEEYRLIDQDVDLRTLEVFKQHFQGEQLLMANEAAHDRRLEPFRKDALPNYHFFSLFFVPITYEQKLLGLLGGYKCESQANWNRDNETFLKSVADQVATGVTNARLYARVQRQATTDGLTGLLNHRTGQEKLAEQLRLAERYQRNLAVVMIDVDHFKSINDNYGHPAGDSVLKATAKLVKSDCRDVDLPVRYGGEEFLLVLPEVNQEGAAVVAERIRKNLSNEVIQHEDIQITVTASFGIAAFPEDAHNQQQLLDLADKALYLSKRLGRNQVHTAGDLMFEEISPTKVSESPATGRQKDEHRDEQSASAPGGSAETKPKSTPPQKSTPLEAVPAAQLISLPSNTYADFVPTAVSSAAEQKEELVPEVVEMVKALATALYSKSDYNKQHHLETARLSELLAKVMGLSQQQVEQIRVAGLLHDVGTLSIPSDLLNKPGKYSADEREIINQHAVLGAQLLRPIRALKDICEILENHHERWDGTGYPRGLRGEEIPLPARIVSIVDSYHAMISDRPYRDALSRDQAIQTLKAGAGQQWDPFLVDIFVAVLASLNDPRSIQTAPQHHVQKLIENQIQKGPALVSSTLESGIEQSHIASSDPSTVQNSAPNLDQIDDRTEAATNAAPTADEVDDEDNTATATSESGSTNRPAGEQTRSEAAAPPPVLNARQRLLQHSQQSQAEPPPPSAPDTVAEQDLQSDAESAQQAPYPASKLPSADSSTTSKTEDSSMTSETGDSSTASKTENSSATVYAANPSSDQIADSAQEDDDESGANSLSQEKDDLSFQRKLSERSQRTTPTALEQLRRTPPASEAISRAQQLFVQSSSTAPTMPEDLHQHPAAQQFNANRTFDAAREGTESQPEPEGAPPQTTSQSSPSQLFPHLNPASQQLQANPQPTSQPTPTNSNQIGQQPGSNSAQQIPRQPSAHRTYTDLPQQQSPQQSSTSLPQQQIPQQSSTSLPQQQIPQQSSTRLPQQQIPQQSSTSLPQQESPQQLTNIFQQRPHQASTNFPQQQRSEESSNLIQHANANVPHQQNLQQSSPTLPQPQSPQQTSPSFPQQQSPQQPSPNFPQQQSPQQPSPNFPQPQNPQQPSPNFPQQQNPQQPSPNFPQQQSPQQQTSPNFLQPQSPQQPSPTSPQQSSPTVPQQSSTSLPQQKPVLAQGSPGSPNQQQSFTNLPQHSPPQSTNSQPQPPAQPQPFARAPYPVAPQPMAPTNPLTPNTHQPVPPNPPTYPQPERPTTGGAKPADIDPTRTKNSDQFFEDT